MEVYFTSPTLGKIYGTVTTEDQLTYFFKGRTVLICIGLCRKETGGWFCPNDQWLHDYQVEEIGQQIDHTENWLSAQ